MRNLIVVGTDGSGHAAGGVEAAAALAAAWSATVDVVGVHRFLAPEQPEVTPVDAAARELRGRGLSVDALVRRSDPALVLADVAAEENARRSSSVRASTASSPAGSWAASPTWSPSARPATC